MTDWETETPFAFTTGYGLDGIRHDLRAIPVAAKPFSQIELHRVLTSALGITGAPS